MCGIAGFFSPHSAFGSSDRTTIAQKMGQALTHRGPDDGDVWSDEASGVTFSFRRLAILDLSENGRQPMRSVSGRYTLQLNGEIYNYLDLKKEIVGSGKFPQPFRGHSDTEVLLAGFEVWGVEKTLEKANGMFAISVWDRETNYLLLARDRMGEKPLYYGVINGTFLFASELKAFYAFPGFRATLDKRALPYFFRFGYVPAPLSIFKEIKKLTPGCWLRVNRDFQLTEKSFWSVQEAASRGLQSPFRGTISEGERELESLLADSIQKRLISDVPLGAFLSGGLDSSVVVALMQKSASAPVKTFTIGFEEKDYDESGYAAAVAKHLGTEHTELKLSASDTLATISDIATWYDEPLADASQIPTYLVSRLARKSVTVALSGDGGDELFGGYPRYLWGEKVGDFVGKIPAPLRHLVGQGIDSLPPAFLEKGLQFAKEMFPLATSGNNAAEKAKKVIGLFKDNEPESIYRTLVSQWSSTIELLGDDGAVPLLGRSAHSPRGIKELVDRMMYWDQTTYLCDDVLAKVDRASMAVGLEVRVPLLDHRIVELAWSFPKEWKLQGGTSKAILRGLAYKHIPKAVLERPKQGFSLPVDHWLKSALKDWGADLLSESRLKDDGILNSVPVRKLWDSHQSGTGNHQHALWSVLIFQQWLAKYRNYVTY